MTVQFTVHQSAIVTIYDKNLWLFILIINLKFDFFWTIYVRTLIRDKIL